MWLTAAAIRRPLLVSMAILALVVLGWRAYQDLTVELYPKVDFPIVTITTVYPGADPAEVETEVTKPIEENVSTIANVNHVTSRSLQNYSVVTIEFELGTNLDDAVAEVRTRIAAIRSQLPPGIQDPVVAKFDVSALPVLSFGVTGNRPAWQIKKLADDVIAERLARVPGVARVVVTGGDQREIQINLHKDRLAAYNLTLSDIVWALSASNFNLPAGFIRETRQEYLIRSMSKFTSLDEIRNLVIRTGDRRSGLNAPVRLGDVADVVDGVQEKTMLVRLDGKDAVGVSVLRQSDANVVAVAEGVKRELERLKRLLPPDITFAISYDQSKFVLDAIHDVNLALWLGIILAVLVVYLFLHDWRGTFIISLAIPISIFATFFIIRFLGYSLNIMVMTGLSLAVGVLVDDSIVVLENIYRHLERGELPEEAAFNGRTEIGLAAVTITLVDVVVFVPIIFMGGIAGQFFKPFAITVATSVLFSLLVSFTFTPMLAAYWFKRRTKEEHERQPRTRVEKIFAAFDRFWRNLDVTYRHALEWALSNRALVFVTGNLMLLNVMAFMMPLQMRLIVAVLTVLVGIVGALLARRQWKGFLTVSGILAVLTLLVQITPSFGFLPRTDEGALQIVVEAPPQSSLFNTDRIVRKLERHLLGMKETVSVLTVVGSTTAGGSMGGGDVGPQFANLFVKLVEKNKRAKSDKQIAQELAAWTKRNLPGVTVAVSEQTGNADSFAPVQIELLGQDRAPLIRLADQIGQRLSKIVEIRDIRSSWRPGRPELQIRVDREKAADLGFTTGDAARWVRIAYEGYTQTDDPNMKYTEQGEDYPIRIRLAPEERQSPQQILSLPIAMTRDGLPITLGDIASVRLGEAPVVLERKDRLNMITITANLAPWASLGSVQQKIQATLADLDTGGAIVNYGGQFEQMADSFGRLTGSLRLSIVLIYMLMAGLFGSLVLPLSIMLSLPQALVGALLFLMITDKGLTLMSFIGIIMLMGIVTKNAILLVDYTNTLRARGYDRWRAIVEAGETRLRPVLMTTLTLFFGVLPTALELGQGAEFRSPMAIAVLGGLTLSTFLTLLVVPVAYTLFDDAQQAILRWLRGEPQPTTQAQPTR
ncbi:MAG: efflux RND transporter permease subunit [Armatimonadota bacterium]|jgi:HAE1 family hydrophobic/amphiphilic exporter-1|nr:efflux RND transporter permease subunit [Armatimonadota bacterium]MDT7972238.1 efflux RND transporter permease subunit [Armatimonadota bacterium]